MTETILFFAADPCEGTRLRLAEEERDIREALSQTFEGSHFRFESRSAVQVDQIFRHLNEVRPTMLHFSGHGAGESGLILQGPQDQSWRVSAEHLVGIVEASGCDIRLIFLNACCTIPQVEALSEAVDCVIGTSAAFSDESARAFATGFYRALAGAQPVEVAFKQAQVQVALHNFPDHEAPILRIRSGLSAQSLYFGLDRPALVPPSELDYQIVIDNAATEGKIDAELLEDLTEALNQYSPQSRLWIRKTKRGSLKIFFTGDDRAAAAIERAVEEKELRELDGHPILSVSGPETVFVEQPFIEQLQAMGWIHTPGREVGPESGARESLRDVLLTSDLMTALQEINRNESGEPWLDDDRIRQAVNRLQRLTPARLMESNQEATELLLSGTTVPGLPGWDGGRDQTLSYIDWENPEQNTFRVVDQFHVKCPEGQIDPSVRLDLVLFVNGIPLVVVEAKSPTLTHPVEEAVEQLQRYANRRRAMGLVDSDEGIERLFHYNQLMVATCFEEARVGTFSAPAIHFLEWKDTSPEPQGRVAGEAGFPPRPLSSQELLVGGLLRPGHLLDVIRHFTLFQESQGRVKKIVCRYQQFRAVHATIDRLKTGATREHDGEHDQRGGLLWHTQGSGKSLTLVFLIRKMRSDEELRPFKIVVVTDRRDLEKQLAETAVLTEEQLTVIKTRKQGMKTVPASKVLQETLSRPGKDLVFAMIQKYRGDSKDDDLEERLDDDMDAFSNAKTEPLPELNRSEQILVVVDEAHRSHTSVAHANLMRALPNCAKVGLTGTPIIMRAKGKTSEIFGSFIDRYTIREAEADGAVVPILYEGRTAEAAVEGGGRLDHLFEDLFAERTEAEREAIKVKYAAHGPVAEATKLIEAKAEDMLRHYVANILPNGFKAQVVASSRRATVRYYHALRKAQANLIADIEALPEEAVGSEGLGSDRRFLVDAQRFLPTIRALQFAPIISPDNKKNKNIVDPEGEWSTQAKVDERIARFKKPLFWDEVNNFGHPKADPLAFLIVKSMLLTGFDAPVEQVLYLDRSIKEAELLQAVARVNRTYSRRGVEKGFGIVVDYYGVANHLKEALAAYSAADVDGSLESLKDEIPKLRARHQRCLDVFLGHGLQGIDDVEACVGLLSEERLRAELHVKLRRFLSTLDVVLPRPEGLPYLPDAKTLTLIQARARNRYRTEDRLIGAEVGEKVRKLIDDHIVSLGINPRIDPIEITSSDFDDQVDRLHTPRAKASEMEHALRYHIRQHLKEDPEHYQKLSERLKKILKDLEGRWEEMVTALKSLTQEIKEGRPQDDLTGLDPQTQAPFLDVLAAGVTDSGELPQGELLDRLCRLTIEIVEHIQQEIQIVKFWAKPQARDTLRAWLFRTLDDSDLLPYEQINPMTDRLMELAKNNHHKLTQAK